MDTCKSVLVGFLLLSFLIAVTFASSHESASSSSSAEHAETSLSPPSQFGGRPDTEHARTPQIEKRSGFYGGGGGGGFHSAVSYALPSATGFAYAKPHYYTTPVVKYPVYHNKPHYHLHHGGASVHSYHANYPRYPIYKSILKYPSVPTVVRPNTVFTVSGPAFAPPKPIIPVAFNPISPILPTAASAPVRPIVLNPSIFTGLNPQLIPISVSGGTVFANYPSVGPTPIAPSAWRPIAVPTLPTPAIAVQRPSIAILPPLQASTLATIHQHGHGSSATDDQHHHHHYQPVPHLHVSSTAASLFAAQEQQHHHNYHHHQHHQQQQQHHELFEGEHLCASTVQGGKWNGAISPVTAPISRSSRSSQIK